MRNFVKSMFCRFRSDREGALTLETVILLPTLMFLMIGLAGMFDLMAKQTDALRATQSVSDLVSRQTEVDNEFLDRLFEVYTTMAGSGDESSAMRVTSIRETSDGTLVDWSYVVGQVGNVDDGISELADNSSEVSSRVPQLVAGEAVVLLETYRDYDVPFQLMSKLGVENMVFENYLVFPLRFSVRLANLDFPQAASDSDEGLDDDDDPTDPGAT